MPSPIIIEPLTDQEIPELADLASRTFTEANIHSMTPQELETALAESRSVAYFGRTAPTSEILLAKDGPKIVGYTQFGDVKMTDAGANPEDGEFGRLYVDSAYQRQGIGRQLMEASLEHPRLKKAPRVFLQIWDENEKARALYEQFGFKVCGETHFVAGGRAMSDLIMVREQRS